MLTKILKGLLSIDQYSSSALNKVAQIGQIGIFRLDEYEYLDPENADAFPKHTKTYYAQIGDTLTIPIGFTFHSALSVAADLQGVLSTEGGLARMVRGEIGIELASTDTFYQQDAADMQADNYIKALYAENVGLKTELGKLLRDGEDTNTVPFKKEDK